MQVNYDQFLELLRRRRTIRRFKPDPVPDDYIMKILDAGHYAMSGANSQPWEFIVVKDPEMRKKIFQGYRGHFELMYYLEQQRIPEYRHPAFNVTIEEKHKAEAMAGGWGDAPVLIIVIEDARKIYGAVLGARGDFKSEGSKGFGASMGHLCMTIHLAAAALGLGSQRVDVAIQEPFRQLLKVPEPLHVNVIIPVGYSAYLAGPPARLPLKDMVHFEEYDMGKFMRNEDFLEYLKKIRALSRPGYRVTIGEAKKG